MTSIATGKTVWSNEVSEIGVVDKHDVPAVVLEMNPTMGLAIENLVSPVSAGWGAGLASARKTRDQMIRLRSGSTRKRVPSVTVSCDMAP